VSIEQVMQEIENVTWLGEVSEVRDLLERLAAAKAKKPRKNQSVRSLLRLSHKYLGKMLKKLGPVLKDLERLRVDLQISRSSYDSARSVDRRRLNRTRLRMSHLEDSVREMFFPFTRAREGIKTIANTLEIERRPFRVARSKSKDISKDSVLELFDTMIDYATSMERSMIELESTTKAVRRELIRLSKSPTRSPETERIINEFLDLRDQLGVLVYRYTGGIKKRLNSVKKRFKRGQSSVRIESIEEILQGLEEALALNSPLRRRDVVTRAARRINDKTKPGKYAARRKEKRMREKRDFKNRLKNRLKRKRERLKKEREAS